MKLSLLFPIAYLIILLLIYWYSTFTESEQLQRISTEIVGNSPSDIEILMGIIKWEWNNINPVYDRPAPFPYLRISEPGWILTVKYGACEEHAVLFAALAKSAGFESRVIRAPAEDHNWAEVLINGTWIHVDPSPGCGYLNDPTIYERIGNGWGHKFSYVYYLDSDDVKHDVTEKYTNTGQLIVRIEKDSRHVENATVIVKSRFLMEKKPERYPEPKESLRSQSDSSGTSVFKLGGNNYTVIAEKDAFFGIVIYRNETTIALNENGISEVVLSLNSVDYGRMIVGAMVIISMIGIGMSIRIHLSSK